MLSAPTAPIVACEPLAAHALSSMHAPAPPRAPTASATMTDLQAELNCHRGGEDSRITIERQCERRRNLKGEFDSLAPAWEAPTVRAMRPLAPLGFREDAWRSLCISVWWSGRASFGPTYQRSTMGLSTPSNSYRSTPPLSLQREATRPSWPTTSLWP
jgi:hypothetical protein